MIVLLHSEIFHLIVLIFKSPLQAKWPFLRRVGRQRNQPSETSVLQSPTHSYDENEDGARVDTKTI